MKNGMTSFTIKAALFIMIASIIMLFFTAFGSAEWYISLFTALLMLIFLVIINIVYYVKNRRDKK